MAQMLHADLASRVYDELMQRIRETALLASCAELLGWDEETYLPPAGVANRSKQLALLAGLQHQRATDPRVGELLAEVEGSNWITDPESPEAVNVRELRRRFDRQVRVPRQLVQELARTTSLAQQEWAIARRHADFKRFRPWLEKIVQLKRHEADCLGYEANPYHALLEEYEPGARADQIATLFEALGRELGPLANMLTGSRRRPDVSIVRRPYPIDRQRQFAEMAAAAVGFDFSRGRLDTAIHPFAGSVGPDDCRLATRYEPDSFSEGFFSTLHEVGHGLYEQGINAEHYGTPIGEVASLGIHESQSRLWENAVGRSRSFWEYFFPRARCLFPKALGDVDLDAFHFAVNHVERSPTRVGADEVTYNLHILIRFELEQALLTGNLPAADLPAAWNEAYGHHLGLIPPNDALGCLQDGHWAAGMIGYFPTYTLGNVFAAQLFARARMDLPDLDTQFAAGQFAGLRGWLRQAVYQHGRCYPAHQLIARATGEPADHRTLVQALKQKYGELYRI
jgi:carboxypeptidase Taq